MAVTAEKLDAQVRDVVQAAKAASRRLAHATTSQKNAVDKTDTTETLYFWGG